MDRIKVIRDEADRFAHVLATTPTEARCPTCPEWNAGDLLWHLTEVHLFWAGILRDHARTEADSEAVQQGLPPRPEATAEVVRLRADATRALLDQLERLDDAEPRWTWWDQEQTVGFTRRMQTYEATMHRVDAELTAGMAVTPLADDVAAGAVDHCVDVMWGWMPGWAQYESLATCAFVASDTGQRWLVDVGHWTGTSPSGKQYDVPRAVRASGGAAVATASGTVADLALWAWTRGGTVAVTGEPAAIAALDALIATGIQ